ncbi:MAG: hypothetical protein N2C14_08645 [Planctomycetales bacterium]
MGIQITCSSCGKTYKVKDEFSGRIGSCCFCQNTIKIPGEESVDLDDDWLDEQADPAPEHGSSLNLTHFVAYITCRACRRKNLAGVPYCTFCSADLPQKSSDSG